MDKDESNSSATEEKEEMQNILRALFESNKSLKKQRSKDDSNVKDNSTDDKNDK